MVCCVLRNMTGVSKSVTDPFILDYLSDVNKYYGRQAYEVEERKIMIKRLFRKPVIKKQYSLYWDCNLRGEWQSLLCAEGYDALCAYLIGHSSGIQEGIRIKTEDIMTDIQ